MSNDKTTDAKVKTTDSIVVPHYAQSHLVAQVWQLRAIVASITIDSQEMYEEAGYTLTLIKAKGAEIEAMRTSVSKPLNEALRANNANFKEPGQAVAELESDVKKAMLAWQEKVEREAAEERRKAEEQARQQREEEERRAAELRKQADAELDAAADATPEQQQAAIERAASIEQAAVAAAESASMVVARPVFTVAAQAVGTSIRKTWKGEVTDKLALIKHIAANAEAHPDLLALLDVNASAVNARAKALAQHLNLPGVRAYEERSLAARKAA